MGRVEGDARDRRTVSRRGFLGVAAVGLFGAAGTASAQEGTATAGSGDAGTAQAPPAEYQLGAQVSGWTGQKPAAIAEKTNPTLRLAAGRTYTITWVNLDGQDHQLQIVDGEDESIVESDVVGTRGATGAVEFEAGPRTVSYRCSIYPSSMTGRIEIEGGSETTRRRVAEPATRTAHAAGKNGTTSAGSPPPGATETAEESTEGERGTAGESPAEDAPGGEGQNAAGGDGETGAAGTAETAADGQPGLGALAGLAALGGAAALARRRRRD